MVDNVRMRLIEQSDFKVDPVFCGRLFLRTDHVLAPRFSGIRFLSRNLHEAETLFQHAVENEMARQAAQADCA